MMDFTLLTPRLRRRLLNFSTFGVGESTFHTTAPVISPILIAFIGHQANPRKFGVSPCSIVTLMQRHLPSISRTHVQSMYLTPPVNAN